MEHIAFVERALGRLTPLGTEEWRFVHWNHAGRPTDEGVGLLASPGLDAEKVVASVMEVDRYVGNIAHVAVCRSIPDSRFVPPAAVRFYQRLDLPMIGALHHELVLHDLGMKSGWRVVAWSVLRSETDALSTKDGFRSDYNHGAWFIGPSSLGYALGSAPKRDDVGFLKWKALTAGADVVAARVLRQNIEGMAAWARRR